MKISNFPKYAMLHAFMFGLLVMASPLAMAEYTRELNPPPEAQQSDAQSSVSEEKGKMNDAEILALVIATNENEIEAAKQAADKENVDPQVAEYAKRMQEEHGRSLDKTLELSQKINVEPQVTEKVEEKKDKSAKEISKLAPLEGNKFEKAFITCMIKDHKEALKMIDHELLKNAQNDELKGHLAETRGHIASHLQEAERIKEDIKS